MIVSSKNNVAASTIHFEGDELCVVLNDSREIRVRPDRISWLKWLADATLAQRSKWSIEPGGFAIYWEELDDGVEVSHLLASQPLG